MEIMINLKDNSYPIYIKQKILDEILTYVQSIYQGKKIIIISDDNVYPYYGNKITQLLSSEYEVSHILVPHGESSKSFSILPSIYRALLQYKITRTDMIITLGGGVVGDLAGFVASTYLRGVPLIQIPTSLLAQVDSSVGGKVAVDLPEGKNLVGAFYHPKMVLIDPLTLQTLNKRYINDGMGEVIKYGCINSPQLFNKLSKYESFQDLYQDIDEIIYHCIKCKQRVIEKDEFDFADRLILNFGHTLGHAIEQYYNYEKYSHGEAVAIGMVQLTLLSESLGLSAKGTSDKLKKVIQKYHLPHKSNLKTSLLLEAISLDKKNVNKKLSIVLLKEIGNSFIHQCNIEWLLQKEII